VLQAAFTHWMRAWSVRTLTRCSSAAPTIARHTAISEFPGGCAADGWGPIETPASQISLRMSVSACALGVLLCSSLRLISVDCARAAVLHLRDPTRRAGTGAKADVNAGQFISEIDCVQLRFPFDHSYARLPGRLFARLDPMPVGAPGLVRKNAVLAANLGLDPDELASWSLRTSARGRARDPARRDPRAGRLAARHPAQGFRADAVLPRRRRRSARPVSIRQVQPRRPRRVQG
jgi:hypothetical protein